MKVKFEGKEYTLQQDAYAENYGTDGEVRYLAKANDNDGNEYLIAWKTTEEWNKQQEIYNNRNEESEEYWKAVAYIEDEQNACNWDNPTEVNQI